MDSTFLPTDVTGDYHLVFIYLGIFTVVIVAAALFAKFGKSGMLPMLLLLIAAFFVFVLAPTTAIMVNNTAMEENDANLIHNVKEVYDVDAIELNGSGVTDDGTTLTEATVYKGDTAYQVEIREDGETFEPTLISYESNEHIRELKK